MWLRAIRPPNPEALSELPQLYQGRGAQNCQSGLKQFPLRGRQHFKLLYPVIEIAIVQPTIVMDLGGLEANRPLPDMSRLGKGLNGVFLFGSHRLDGLVSL